ncbi:MAG: helix-turn-helix domain-containing protein [Bacteroidales bacterium]|jgi:hypothetical protein|nr:helix-turn-helix domain-containing protein [Bacteroidales bacterium]
METNSKLDLAFDYVQFTGEHIFLTGKAGTGKTTFLHRLREMATKRLMVVAPTGVAAINAHGVTIHSFFQLSFGPQIGIAQTERSKAHFSKEKINIIKSMDLLVIDEISMVRADLLDAVDTVLRRFRNRNKPFGGVQLLMIGDLQQLSPIVREDENEILRQHYETPYFFSSKAFGETSFVSIELTHVFRQQDDHFISILNRVRENRLDSEALEVLNKRYIPDFKPPDNEGYITLCTHNVQAQRINESKLNALRGRASRFMAEIEGNFPEYSYPTEFELVWKEKAQVMFIKNDSSADKRFYNGKIGKITDISKDIIRVKCPGDEEEIFVTPMKWDNVKYTLDPHTNEIREEVEGSFIQYPLKLAWAITIHKSQGLTFEHAVIDAQSSFAHGQVYVALSRCKTLEGMILSSPINYRSIINDRTVSGFTQYIEQNQPDQQQLQSAYVAYQHNLLRELFQFESFRFRISYLEKITNDNRGSFAAPTFTMVYNLRLPIQTEIVEVGDKFRIQMERLIREQPNVELNETLQSRLKDASGYFSGKIQTLLIDKLSKIDFDIDNKTVKKQLDDAIARLEEEIRVKQESLKACQNGFHLTDFLQTKAVASIDKIEPKSKQKFVALDNENIEHPILFERLRSWRMDKSTEMDVPPFAIFSQKALYEMTAYLPTTKKMLLQINGIGEIKIKQFGKEMIEIISDYCRETGAKPKTIVAKSVKSTTTHHAPKPAKGDTKSITFELFKQGKSIAEIATERGYVQSTIESHLESYIATGKIDIHTLVPKEKVTKITACFQIMGDQKLSEVKATLGDEFSYGELRLVRASCKKLF